MATSGLGNAIRQAMTQQGMTEDDLIEGCRQILDDYKTAQTALAADQERERTRAWSDEVARQAQSAGHPPDNLMSNITKKMLGGS